MYIKPGEFRRMKSFIPPPGGGGLGENSKKRGGLREIVSFWKKTAKKKGDVEYRKDLGKFYMWWGESPPRKILYVIPDKPN